MERIKRTLRAPSNYKDADKIAAYIEEKALDKWQYTAIDGLGQIVCIAWAVEDEPVKWLIGDEQQMLVRFLTETELHNCYVIGHNVINFDLRFIKQRCYVNNVIDANKTLPFYSRFNDSKVFDTQQAWAGYNGYVSLSNLAYALGIETDPEDISGSQVYDYWKAGNMDAVVRHCVSDVETVRKVAKRMGV